MNSIRLIIGFTFASLLPFSWAACGHELRRCIGVTDLILKASKMTLEDDSFFRDVKKAKYAFWRGRVLPT